jgi:hypothetical protein
MLTEKPTKLYSRFLHKMPVIFLLGLVFVLASCSPNSPKPDSNAETLPNKAYPVKTSDSPQSAYPSDTENIEKQTPVDTVEAPVPEKGKASISGVLYSKTVSRNLSNVVIYLTPAIGSEKSSPVLLYGPDKSKGDVPGITNEKGQFSLNNVPPGNYYLVALSSEHWTFGMISDQNENPKLIILSQDEKFDLGVIYIN